MQAAKLPLPAFAPSSAASAQCMILADILRYTVVLHIF